jgi:hypothetical protein
MAEGRQFDPDRPRLLLDHGDVVELDGGIVAVNGKQDPSVVLRLTPWRARVTGTSTGTMVGHFTPVRPGSPSGCRRIGFVPNAGDGRWRAG